MYVLLFNVSDKVLTDSVTLLQSGQVSIDYMSNLYSLLQGIVYPKEDNMICGAFKKYHSLFVLEIGKMTQNSSLSAVVISVLRVQSDNDNYPN